MCRVPVLALVLGTWLHAGCVMTTAAQGPEQDARREFLQSVDAALASRDPEKLAALADLQQWRAAGRPSLGAATLWLPPSPLKRARDLSASEVLYEDAEGNTWRLRFHRDDAQRAWRVTILSRPCPPKTSPRGGVTGGLADDASSQRPPAASTIWTPVECWPLPR
jgi:hypothetical protein